MTQVARYQPQRLFADHEAVKTFHGLDPLTGLPVLIYRFAGRPTAKVGELKSEAIPTILTSTVESGRGQLVVAYAKGYEPLSESVGAHEVAGLLRDSATALYDAARTSVVHGDLRPKRFLKANDHVMVEGYGVPWTTWDAGSEFSAPERIGGASAPADVFSWARTVQFLAGRHLPGELSEMITACLNADPKYRPNAETIYKQIVQPGEPAAEAAEASPFDNLDFAEPKEKTFARNPFVSAYTSASSGTKRERGAPQGDAAGTNQAAHQTSDVAGDDDLFGFGGEIDERPPRRGARGRRTVLLIALLIGLLVLGALALFNRDTLSASVSEALGRAAGAGLGERVTAGAGAALTTFASIVTGTGQTQSGSYLIRVEVIPANVQAELFVVESPAGSSLPLARPVSVVPGSAVLDRTGLWRLQAQVDGRLSDVQEVRVPEERTVTFSVPWLDVPTAKSAE